MYDIVSFLRNHWRASGFGRHFRRRQPKGKNIWDDTLGVFGTLGFKKYWETLPEVQRYQNSLLGGREDQPHFHYALEYIRKNTRARGLTALWLGCVQGDPYGPENGMMETGMFEHIAVMDIARNLLEKNEQAARQWGFQGIEYVAQDLNEVSLPRDAFDVIYTEGTLHHIDKLERLLEQVAAALRPDGLFIVKDYAGPDRLQFTPEQARIIDAILAILPEKYRTTEQRAVKDKHFNYAVKDVVRVDPSESIHPQLIQPAIRRIFEVKKFVKLGGTILHPLLNDIAGNFEGSPEADLILKMLILMEKTLVAEGAIPSDYFYCIAGKRV